jgi:hypothetical protein
VRSLLSTITLIAFALLAGGDPSQSLHANSTSQQPNRAQLLAAARAGGDYLVRMQKRDGSFHYYYNAADDRVESRTYNIVRHAGVAASLFDLYRVTRDARYRESARLAVNFLKSRFHRARSRNSIYVLDFDGKAKLGANGLALVAFVKQIELDPGNADRQSAARLANLILAMQRRDGSFNSRYQLRAGDQEGFESLYYPGEAILGMVGLFKLNGDRRLLDSARRGADFLIQSQRNLGALPPDAWLMQALEALYNIGREANYAVHVIALAEAMIADQYTDDDPPGYLGGFGPGPPRSTPAASRAEGLISSFRIARSTSDPRASRFAGALRACASFQLAQQITGKDDATLPNPRRAIGGFVDTQASTRIRIDFVQHNISSLLGIAEALY